MFLCTCPHIALFFQLCIQGEREAAEVAAIEASRAVAGQAVEEEMERLAAELAAVKVRPQRSFFKRVLVNHFLT